MRLAVAVTIALSPLVGCLEVSTDTGTGTSASGSSASSDSGSGGTNCTTDPASGVVLCAEFAACPSVAVDPSAFPSCGFRASEGATLDLECLCSGWLCPIGVATTCAQAGQLLQAQTVVGVCEQVSEGRCVELAVPEAGTVAPGCDRTCQSECGSAADCLQLCGC